MPLEIWCIMIPKTELPGLGPDQLAVLHRFLVFQAGIADIRGSLSGLFEFELDPERRTASSHFQVPEPGILVTRDHIAKALEREQRGDISQRELIDWATMLLLNDAYQPDPKDEDFVAEWLNRISYELDPT
jgi:hypothetical protein